MDCCEKNNSLPSLAINGMPALLSSPRTIAQEQQGPKANSKQHLLQLQPHHGSMTPAIPWILGVRIRPSKIGDRRVSETRNPAGSHSGPRVFLGFSGSLFRRRRTHLFVSGSWISRRALDGTEETSQSPGEEISGLLEEALVDVESPAHGGQVFASTEGWVWTKYRREGWSYLAIYGILFCHVCFDNKNQSFFLFQKEACIFTRISLFGHVSSIGHLICVPHPNLFCAVSCHRTPIAFFWSFHLAWLVLSQENCLAARWVIFSAFCPPVKKTNGLKSKQSRRSPIHSHQHHPLTNINTHTHTHKKQIHLRLPHPFHKG